MEAEHIPPLCFAAAAAQYGAVLHTRRTSACSECGRDIYIRQQIKPAGRYSPAGAPFPTPHCSRSVYIPFDMGRQSVAISIRAFKSPLTSVYCVGCCNGKRR